MTSILHQSYSDFEVLLIDDGSSDSSGNICEQFSVEDCRVRVFHQVNGGVSSARNKGLSEARGEYLCFIDSDDYVGSHYLSDMVEAYIPDSFSLVITGMKLLCNGQFQTFNYQNETVTTNIRVYVLYGRKIGFSS